MWFGRIRCTGSSTLVDFPFPLRLNQTVSTPAPPPGIRFPRWHTPARLRI